MTTAIQRKSKGHIAFLPDFHAELLIEDGELCRASLASVLKPNGNRHSRWVGPLRLAAEDLSAMLSADMLPDALQRLNAITGATSAH